MCSHKNYEDLRTQYFLLFNLGNIFQHFKKCNGCYGHLPLDNISEIGVKIDTHITSIFKFNNIIAVKWRYNLKEYYIHLHEHNKFRHWSVLNHTSYILCHLIDISG